MEWPRRKHLSELALLAIVGQVVLLASAWMLPIVSEFGLVGDNISELVLGRLGFIQVAAFVIAGLGTLGLAMAIRKLTPGAGGFAGTLLVGVYGAGAILSAVFPTDRVDSASDLSSLSAAGTIHVAVAFVSFLCIIAAMFVLTWTFLRQRRWWRVSWWWMLFPAGALSLLFVQSEGPLVGLMQRLLVTLVAAWLVLVAFKVRAMARSFDTSSPVPADR